MSNDILSEIRDAIPATSARRDECIRRAFHMLPRLDKPRILDIGCGRGGPTLELAQLGQGEVVGLDIRQCDLDELERKAAEAGLSHRVKTVNRSMFEIDFPDESFDIAWSEGSIFVIGFERGLREWRRLIKRGRYLVVHDATWLRPGPPQEIVAAWKESMYPITMTVAECAEVVPSCGYDLLHHFALPEDFWWHEYFGPLQQCIDELRRKYADDAEALRLLDREQRNVDLYGKHPQWYGSAYFIMRKS
ncbi:MAG: class I SAM-dependent methyltransferase [Chloroflexota bacterium]